MTSCQRLRRHYRRGSIKHMILAYYANTRRPIITSSAANHHHNISKEGLSYAKHTSKEARILGNIISDFRIFAHIFILQLINVLFMSLGRIGGSSYYILFSFHSIPVLPGHKKICRGVCTGGLHNHCCVVMLCE